MKNVDISAIAGPSGSGQDLENISSCPSNFTEVSEKVGVDTAGQVNGAIIEAEQPVIDGPSNNVRNLSVFSSEPMDMGTETRNMLLTDTVVKTNDSTLAGSSDARLSLSYLSSEPMDVSTATEKVIDEILAILDE